MQKKKAFKLDIFSLLTNLSTENNYKYWDKLTDDEKKEFSPLVVMRWLSGTSDIMQIVLLNEFANMYIYPLSSHPGLLMDVLSTSTSKVPHRYFWLGIKTKSKKTLQYDVLRKYFDISNREVKSYTLPPADEIISMAEEMGYQKDEMSKLKLEIKNSSE